MKLQPRDFADDLGVSKDPDTLEKAINFLKDTIKITSYKDISDTDRGISEDIDLLVSYDSKEPWHAVELKIRDKKYARKKDIALETLSSVETNTLGWLFRSKATLLCYVFPFKTNCIGGVFYLAKLREWWQAEGQEKNYAFKDSRTRARNGAIYRTRNYLVPIEDLPGEVWADSG